MNVSESSTGTAPGGLQLEGRPRPNGVRARHWTFTALRETTANPTERARETYAYAEEIDVSVSELREWGCGLRVCGELFLVKWNMELDSICGFSYVPSEDTTPTRVTPPTR